ncbi:RagB/SusD family nutrient uptake outer membrane protein [Flavobacterium johnsoniae]|uniref:RagB/SusD domain-containing protein n=1 Tax=Flavobacterium johnsoniae TaxID=986 RepID=A0A1M5Q7B2_FLAJO|nr:RagB/SusD family nutrient uptake outer membrane protein [Flavobacterium johnsoniae]SHH09373.1 RagB/SusD domain-containing protein [Flavobacterium johnsoniae]
MKNLFNTSINALCHIIIISMFSCDSFVEVDLPKSQLTTPTVFEDYNTASAALLNIYSNIRDAGIFTGTAVGISNQLGNYADEIKSSESPTNSSLTFYKNTLLPANTVISGYWNAAYNQIYAANGIIEGSAASRNLTLEQKNQLQGEALFIRALVHFYLTNLFGDIPYITSTDYKENSTVSRKPVAEIYGKLTTDLENAILLLPVQYQGQERVRPNVLTAKALLARVYLYSKAYPEAANASSAVLNREELYHLESPDRTFLLNSNETIWQLQAGAAGRNTAEAATFTFISIPPPRVSLSSFLVDSFGAGDLRRSLWIKAVTKNTSTFYHAYKYKENNSTAVSKEYAIMFRLAEQYLIRAEARAYQGDLIGAKEDLNKVRHRAGLIDTSAATQQEILDAIIIERKWELFTEYGHRFFDLKRTAKLDIVLSGIKPGWNTTDNLLPIPQSEFSANPFLGSQNPGY